jgi:hypothetical protein
MTARSGVIHEPENTRQFLFFIVHRVLENQSRGDRKIAVPANGMSSRNDAEKKDGESHVYVRIYTYRSSDENGRSTIYEHHHSV